MCDFMNVLHFQIVGTDIEGTVCSAVNAGIETINDAVRRAVGIYDLPECAIAYSMGDTVKAHATVTNWTEEAEK